jgi:hypothetical protein
MGGYSQIILEDIYGIYRFYLKDLAAPFGTWSNGRKLKINETLWITSWYMIIGLGMHEKYLIEEFEPEEKKEETIEVSNDKILCNVCCENDKNVVIFPCNHFMVASNVLKNSLRGLTIALEPQIAQFAGVHL